MHKVTLLLMVLLLPYGAYAQGRKLKVLFLGNSYTNTNNLPGMLASAATSAGDTLVYRENTPGGFTFQGHTTSATSLALIRQGGWDVVVLQEQSQRPSFRLEDVQRTVFPYAFRLDSLIKAHSPAARTYFYMTWGRKAGDATNCSYFPPLCTYAGMDSLLRLRYEMMADTTGAAIAPVGPVWRRIRRLHPTIELYQSDASHPVVAGTYAAVCGFYATLYGKDPTRITYNAGLAATVSATIRNAAKVAAYDSLAYWRVSVPTATAQETPVRITAWPNPANDVLTVAPSWQTGQTAPQCWDMQGKQVKLAWHQQGNTWTAHVRSLPHGLYTLSWDAPLGIVRIRWVRD